MKKSALLYSLLLLGLLHNASCSKILDTLPELSVDESRSIVDRRSAIAALNGAYNGFTSNSYYGNSFRYISTLQDDNVYWVGNSPTNREFDVYNVFATNSRVQELWSAIYRPINTVNHIIEKVPQLEVSAITPEERDRITGEAYYLRAQAYFDLFRLWDSIPITTLPTKTPQDGVGSRKVGASEIFARIEQDLDSAAVKLAAVPLNRNRANRFAVLALRAKVSSWKGDWQAVLLHTQPILAATSSFQLVRPYRSFYGSKNTMESILELDYTINNRNSYAQNWFQSPTNGGRREFLPTAELVSLLQNPQVGGDRSVLLFTVANITYGNMNFKIATGEDQAYIHRLADVVLLRAEAFAQQDRLSEGLALLNSVRERSSVSPILSISTKETLLRQIEEERRVEFALEGHRFFDLKRTGRAQSVLNIEESFRLRLPIPRQEVFINEALQQNPGY